ncbi:uncharacterized protein LOC128896599 [Hylaeus anthracinus]|uniref:uncharacterized protein LOC128896599 n=1 Tax=Hylaeus anthracinus TaxID=313031 RepID=UPI0023B8AE6A|nr:uncharacterized protein LOC128896599 [Hylaeus anthracinus]
MATIHGVMGKPRKIGAAVKVLIEMCNLGLPLTKSIDLVTTVTENLKIIPGDYGEKVIDKMESVLKWNSYDTIDLLSDDIEDEIDTIDEILISPFVYPLKYQLELTPIININGPSRLNGHVAIEFYVNDTTGLTILSLNAKNITVSNYKLSLLNPEEDKTRLRRRQRRRADGETNYQRHHDDTTLERDVTFTPTENETFLYKQDAEYPLENVSFVEASKGSSAKHSSFNKTEINLSEIEVTRYETDENNEIHTLYLGSPIQEGIYSLEIAYEAGIDDNAFFVANYSGSGEEKWLLGTKLKRSDARYLFPVFEDADYKSVFSVSIARSTEMRALSNMPLMVTNDTYVIHLLFSS